MLTMFIILLKYICVCVKIHQIIIYLCLGQNPSNNNVTNIILFEILRQVILLLYISLGYVEIFLYV